MSRTTMIESLPCKLTGPEKLQKSDALVAELGGIRDDEETKKNATSAISQRIKERKAKVSSLGAELRSGEEFRDVECFERPLFDVMKVELVRCDTGDVVRTRGMHPSERQKSMEFDGASPTVQHPAGKRKRDHKAERARRKEEKELEAARRVNSDVIEELAEGPDEQTEEPIDDFSDEHTEH